MQLTSLCTAAAALAGFAAAAPSAARRSYGTPSDGFPNPNPSQLAVINNNAGGTLSNAGAPTINPKSIPIFQLIEFNENFEVAFFGSLIENVTAGHYDNEFRSSDKKQELLDVLVAVLAQEELHAINAGKVLTANNAFAPPPCIYKFPTDNVHDAINLAETFTALVLGTLQDGSQGLSVNGDNGAVRAVASVIGQEGEQNGFYRTILGRLPNEKPFLTTSIAAFAFSALQGFIVSCPFDIAKEIPITIFTPLNVLSGDDGRDVSPEDQQIAFSADLSSVTAAKSYTGGSGSGLFITYFTGQDLPISEPISDVHWDGDVVTFKAFFPFTANVMEGLTIASLTTSANFTSADAVAGATLAAPGLMNVNRKL